MKWVCITLVAMRHANGLPWFIHGVGVDITTLKTAERSLPERISLGKWAEGDTRDYRFLAFLTI